MPMAGRLLFLSDAHLCPEAPGRTRCLVDFLRGHGRDAAAVYILGDLFDFWVGAKQRRHPAWAALLEQLAGAVRDGPETCVLGGNRDYLLDAASLAGYGLRSLGREHTFTADGTRFALVHGVELPSLLLGQMDETYLCDFEARAFQTVYHMTDQVALGSVRFYYQQSFAQEMSQ